MVKDGTGGVLAGINPVHYSESNPIALFIIQVVLIIVVTRAIHYLLIWFRQPRVISEVVGGILLGPSVLGRIPGFKDHIFPEASLVNLNLLATLGLILFLFIVGVELNPKLLLKNAKVAVTISAAGIALPFTLGIGVGYGLYKLMNNESVSFVTFILFSGVAMSITAFPVLARILSELQLLRTPVGTTALTAGVGDDICAWVLLALVVSIINSSNSLNALYIFLMAIGWILIVVLAIRPILLKLVIKTGSENGPSLSMMAITLCLVLISSFVTDIIGVHAIFGGFIIGVIVPHEGGFALGITEKIEDIVNVLFLPIYFTLSGLKTQIGLLNDAKSWGWVFVVLITAVVGKVSGCTLAARSNKLTWRESFTIGVFMSCKGLVELIVLNIGLDAGIIDQRIFVIMVIMALVTTFMTTPLATYLYPHEYQRKMELSRARKDKEKLENETILSNDLNKPEDGISTSFDNSKMLVVLNKVEYLPAMMTLVQLLQPPIALAPESSEKNKKIFPKSNPLTVNVLRLVELTQRISAVMKFHETEETTLHDPIMNIFRSFGQLNLIKVKANLAVSPLHEFHQQVLEKAEDTGSNLVIIPWGGAGALIDDPSNPLEEVLGPRQKKETSPQVANFIQDSFHYITKVTNLAVFVDRGLGIVAEDDAMNLKALRVFLPFFGGVDDREALSFVLRLLEHPHVTIYVLRLIKSSKPTTNDVTITSSLSKDQIEHASSSSDRVQRPPLIHKMSTASGHVLRSKVERQASDNADDAILKQYLKNQSVISSNERISYVEVDSSTPLQTAVERSKDIVGSKDLVVLGRGRQSANLNHREEFLEIIKNLGGSFGNDTRKSLGDVAESFLVGGVTASILVVQAKKIFDDDSKSINSNLS